MKSKVACKPVFNGPSKHVEPNVPCKRICKVTRELSNCFVGKSASLAFDSPGPSYANL